MFLKMLVSRVFSSLSLIGLTVAQKIEPFGVFSQNHIYDPPAGDAAVYPRLVELQDGTLLVTSSLTGYSPPFFPVFESKDGGASWKWISNITDQVNGWGMGAQPALAELTEQLGDYAPGTILASGNSWKSSGTSKGTRIDLYASKDKARTWEFVSRIAQGGPPNTTNGATPVWEPFLLLVDSRDSLEKAMLTDLQSV
jgi:hypothetical protein